MKVQSAGKTHTGLKMRVNEDRILMADKLGLFVVADGIGGSKAGDVASQMVVDIMGDYWKKLRENSPPQFIGNFDNQTPYPARHLLNSISLSNVIVYEEGSGSVVSIVDPISMLGVVDDPNLTPVAEEARIRLRRVIEAVGE